MRHLLAGLLVLLPCAALAQTYTLEHSDPSRGVTLPPTSPALADEAFAPQVNPAGLSQLSALQLYYAHERSIARGEVGDGIYVGNTFGPLGVGLNVEWIRSTRGELHLAPDRRKTTLGLSLGSDTLSLGASFGFFSSEENAFLDKASTVDLGVLARPNRYLSLGAVVTNLNAPAERAAAPGLAAPTVLPRSFDLAVGVRPFGDRFTFGLDYRFTEMAANDGRLSYVLGAEVVRGVLLHAGVSHGISPSGELAFQLGATFNLPSAGVSYATGTAGGALDHVITARVSTATYPGFGGANEKVVMLDFSQLLSKGGSSSLALIGGSETDAYLKLTRLLAQAEQDPALAGVVVKLESLPEVGFGRADELRKALLRLRASGKRVLAVLLTAGDAEYLVATGADRIYALPQSMLLINGVAANVTFLGGTMEKLGVTWDVAKVGAYKNAPDQMTRTDMTDEQRETINAYLDVDLAYLETTIANARKIPIEQVRTAISEGLLVPSRAKELGLLDGIIQPTDLAKTLKEELPSARYDGEYAFSLNQPRNWGHRKQIAIVPIVGSISSGKTREDPLGIAEIAGAETVVRALKEAEENSDVAAIVVRIDSGGGDGLASDLMYRAVLEAKKKKPVIASMGDVAASGGYYAAMGATKIYASPTTITGSIGVFMMKPALGGLMEKLGVTQETIKRGELATLLSTSDPWTEAEQAAAQKWVDAFYDDFITEVATSRKLEKARVDELARGRVWAGATAKELGLIDELGTLQEAVDGARAAAGIPDHEQYDLVIMEEEPGLFGNVAGAVLQATDGVTKLKAPPSPVVDVATRAALQRLGVAPSVLMQPGVKALLPFGLRVE